MERMIEVCCGSYEDCVAADKGGAMLMYGKEASNRKQ